MLYRHIINCYNKCIEEECDGNPGASVFSGDCQRRQHYKCGPFSAVSYTHLARDLGGPSPLPSLHADADASALYIAAGTEITEENLAPLLGAALNQPAQTGEDAGILAVTASPTPLSYGELLSRLSSTDEPEATPSASPTAASSLAEGIQALALYDEEGIRAGVLLPGSQVDGAALETITGMLSRLGHYGLQEEELEALASQNPEAAQITLCLLYTSRCV